MRILVGMLVGAAVVVGAALAFADEKKKKGGAWSILLGSQVVIPNTDDNLNAIEKSFGWPLESVATRYLTTSPNGTLFTAHFLPSADTPAMPKVGSSGTTATGVPFKVVSVVQAPIG